MSHRSNASHRSYRLALMLCAGLVLSVAVLSGALATVITDVTIAR